MSRELRLETSRGPVTIIARAAPEQVADLVFDEGIGVFSQFRSLLTKVESLYRWAEDPDSDIAVAVHEGSRIVGFCVRRPPEAGERWAEMDPPILYEIFGETSRNFRDQKLMKPLTRELALAPENEDRILYIVGYSWHWDLDYSRKTLTQYRDTIIHLLTPLGFKQYPTNEPNVSLRSENLFMARIGANLARPIKRRFTNLLFGIVDD